MKSPLILRLLLAVVHDVRRFEPDVKGLDRDIITIKARFKHEGAGFLSCALSSLCDAVDYGLATGHFACPHGFSTCHGGALPKLLSGLLCKVFDDRTGSLRESASVESIKSLRQILRLFKKLKLESSREESLHDKAVGVFWDTDLACTESFNPVRASLLSRVAGYGLNRLGSYLPERCIPKHGPGAVLERLAPNQKWQGIYQSILDEDFDHGHFGVEPFGILGGDEPSATRTARQDVHDHISDQCVKEAVGPLSSHGLSSGLVARLVSVAKNSTSRRTITIEPLLGMFYQQALNTGLREAIARDTVLSRCLSLTDQSVNQTFALEGSRSGEWATLDLSAASDRLSNELVKLVFARHREFYFSMIACRSSEVYDPLKKARTLRKFAGMGNALTFPVQSVVFANIAMAAILFCEGYSAPSFWDVRRVSRLVRVYGDDIIVPTYYARQVVDWIESFGLLVNRKKSFMEGYFRESCGLDAYRGHDVTPVYVRDDPEQLAADPSIAASLVSTSNQLWMLGHYSAATLLQEVVDGTLGRLPILSEDSGGLGWHIRSGACEYQRWNKHLHYLEVRAPVVVPKFVKDPIGGYAALLKFFLTPLIQRDGKHLERSVKRFKTRIVWRWMPARAGSLSTDKLIAVRQQARRFTGEIRFTRPKKARSSHQRKSG